MKNPLGIYEKALPKDLDWAERFQMAKKAGYDFLEISIDETPERMARLDWSLAEKLDFFRLSRENGIPVPSMCLSGHRKIPFGSTDPKIRQEALSFMGKAIEFASDTGIRVIQLAGYDVYYEKPTLETKKWYHEGMIKALEIAAQYQVTLAMEIMDTPFMNSISRYLSWKEKLPSPWFMVYPDIGNLTAWGNDIEEELSKGINDIVAIHLKETKPVGPNFPGAFRDTPFGEGTVDFVHCFEVLQKLKYAGPFLVEMWTEKSADPFKEIVEAKKWLEERMQLGGFK